MYTYKIAELNYTWVHGVNSFPDEPQVFKTKFEAELAAKQLLSCFRAYGDWKTIRAANKAQINIIPR